MKYIIQTILILISFTGYAQDKIKSESQESEGERLEDPYLAPDGHSNRVKGKSYKLESTSTVVSSIVTKQINVDAGGNNITLDAANEPNLAISPANPNLMVIGWRQFDNVLSNFRQAGYSYSSDGGLTWSPGAVIDPGVFRTDPVLDCDSAGNFYYNSLTQDSLGNYSCHVFKSMNGGVTWDTGTFAHGGDKQWMYIDKSGNGINNNYTFWSSNLSSCMPYNFSRSTNGGVSYGSCENIPSDPNFGTMDMDDAGALYIGGVKKWTTSDSVFVSKCDNPTAPSLIWNAKGVYLDGRFTINTLGTINPGGLIGQINLVVDHNPSALNNVYLAASLDRYSNFDAADVMFSRSVNGGQNWSQSIRINDDPTQVARQWLGTISVAPNGRIDAVWLDTRGNPASDSSALFYSYSYDQGNTWSVNEILSAYFDPHVGYPNQSKMGDYFDMISDNISAHLVWANTLNGEQDVYYSLITPPPFTAISELAIPPVSIYPNPSTGNVKVNSLLPIQLIEIYSVDGTLTYTKQNMDLSTELDLSNLSKGIYFLNMHFQNGKSLVKKLIIVPSK